MNINVTCSVDGRLTLKATACRVVIRIPGSTTIEFFCPKCYRFEATLITDKLAAELRAGGVKIWNLEVPDEAIEPHNDPPISLIETNLIIAEIYSHEQFEMPMPRRPILLRSRPSRVPPTGLEPA